MTQQYLAINLEKEATRICEQIKLALRTKLHRRGLVVAISGGIDSATCAALAVKALGPKKVFGLLMPETDSSAQSTQYGKKLAESLGIEYVVQDIAPTLEAIGCYKWRDDAIRNIFPEYNENWKSKITIHGGIDGQINHFKLIVQNPQGAMFENVMGLNEYLTVVAATNFKQRIRKNLEYFHADRLNYAVVGTPNRLEYDQGFFVKNGDGAADIKPIAHLYKTQVYQMAEYLGVPPEICNATPTTDTYSLDQGQDEFYFALDYKRMDVALWHLNHNKTAADLAEALAMTEVQAQNVYNDIKAKRKTTAYLHLDAVKFEDILF